MFTAPSGVPLGPLRSHAAFPKGSPSPGVSPKWTATRARSTTLITMSGGGSGPTSETTPAEQEVQYQLMLPERWNLCHPPMLTLAEVAPRTLVKYASLGAVGLEYPHPVPVGWHVALPAGNDNPGVCR